MNIQNFKKYTNKNFNLYNLKTSEYRQKNSSLEVSNSQTIQNFYQQNSSSPNNLNIPKVNQFDDSSLDINKSQNTINISPNESPDKLNISRITSDKVNKIFKSNHNNQNLVKNSKVQNQTLNLNYDIKESQNLSNNQIKLNDPKNPKNIELNIWQNNSSGFTHNKSNKKYVSRDEINKSEEFVNNLNNGNQIKVNNFKKPEKNSYLKIQQSKSSNNFFKNSENKVKSYETDNEIEKINKDLYKLNKNQNKTLIKSRLNDQVGLDLLQNSSENKNNLENKIDRKSMNTIRSESSTSNNNKELKNIKYINKTNAENDDQSVQDDKLLLIDEYYSNSFNSNNKKLDKIIHDFEEFNLNKKKSMSECFIQTNTNKRIQNSNIILASNLRENIIDRTKNNEERDLSPCEYNMIPKKIHPNSQQSNQFRIRYNSNNDLK